MFQSPYGDNALRRRTRTLRLWNIDSFQSPYGDNALRSFDVDGNVVKNKFNCFSPLTGIMLSEGAGNTQPFASNQARFSPLTGIMLSEDG